jgi:hypothetical protein
MCIAGCSASSTPLKLPQPVIAHELVDQDFAMAHEQQGRWLQGAVQLVAPGIAHFASPRCQQQLTDDFIPASFSRADMRLTAEDVIDSMSAGSNALLVVTLGTDTPQRRADHQPFLTADEEVAVLPVAAINAAAAVLERALGRNLFPIHIRPVHGMRGVHDVQPSC